MKLYHRQCGCTTLCSAITVRHLGHAVLLRFLLGHGISRCTASATVLPRNPWVSKALLTCMRCYTLRLEQCLLEVGRRAPPAEVGNRLTSTQSSQYLCRATSRLQWHHRPQAQSMLNDPCCAHFYHPQLPAERLHRCRRRDIAFRLRVQPVVGAKQR
jgi:hypothetical protein